MKSINCFISNWRHKKKYDVPLECGWWTRTFGEKSSSCLSCLIRIMLIYTDNSNQLHCQHWKSWRTRLGTDQWKTTTVYVVAKSWHWLEGMSSIKKRLSWLRGINHNHHFCLKVSGWCNIILWPRVLPNWIGICTHKSLLDLTYSINILS